MLTDLSFLNKGSQWTPPSERERINKYIYHQKLFSGKHDEVYKEQFKRIERVINNFGEVVSYPVIINYQKLITLKLIDLLLGEEPEISVGESNSPEQIALSTIKERSDLINTAYMVAIDISRYGDGLFYIYGDNEGGKIGFTQPQFWYPVVNPINTQEILQHVIAYTQTATNDNKKLIVHIHNKGSIEYREYRLITGLTDIIGELIVSNTFTTGLDDFAVIQVSNVKTTDSIYGYDDYTDIDSIVSEILVRVAQISRILDKHSSPSVQGASSCLEKDPVSGEWKLKMGNFFPRDSKDDPDISYITWDGQLQAAFQELEELKNMLYLTSETGSTLLGETDKAGQAASGTALRLKMSSPLAKVKRLRMRFDGALKKAIYLCSQLSGKGIINLSEYSINITWQDGIQDDPLEEAQITSILTQNKAVMSQFTAIKKVQDLDEESAEQELERIREEEVINNPLSGTNLFSSGSLNETDVSNMNGEEDSNNEEMDSQAQEKINERQGVPNENKSNNKKNKKSNK